MSATNALRNLLAPFQPALADPNTTEVVVNEPGRFGVEVGGEWKWFPDKRLTFERLDALGVQAAYASSQEISPANPLCGATLPGGERIQICRPSATLPQIISLTIRKPSKDVDPESDEASLEMFTETNSPTPRRGMVNDMLVRLYERKAWPEFFRMFMREKRTIGVCGIVGSGKTTFLKRRLAEIPSNERIVTIEDTSEFGTAGPRNKVALLYGDGRSKLTAEDALKASLRMRPDRIIMQEVRGPEAFGYIRALASGHAGATSWHAEEGREWDALELMVKQHPAGRGIPDDSLRRYLRQHIDCIVYLTRDNGYKVSRVWFKEVAR